MVEVDTQLINFRGQIDYYKNSKLQLMENISDETNELERLYTSLKKELVSSENKISYIDRQINELYISLGAKQALMKNYNNDRLELEATIESMYKLKNDLQTVVCPICESKLKPEKKKHTNIQVIKTGMKQIDKRLELLNNVIHHE